VVKIKRDELEKALDAFVKEIKVMLHAFDKDAEAKSIEEIYSKKRDVMIADTIQYLKEVEHIEVL